GDAAPLAEPRSSGLKGQYGEVTPPERIRKRREERAEAIRINSPDRFYDMPEVDRRQLMAWVRGLPPVPRVTAVKDSYWLKHRAEKALGFYVSNAELKGAMLEAGYRPVWDDRINMGFRCGRIPGGRRA
ncbi:MAG: hypothetical protein M3441_29130, partial [Chloroflexota bacterium]|nr:hypothetical protein [Chloroflexota bacterium]